MHARWDADDASLRVYTSTQASTSVRAAIAAKLELSLDKVEVIAPDVGGGFGVKIVHPWPEELLVPLAAIALGREVKWTEDRREHFISSAHERQQRQEITVGYDDDGRITALDVHVWHDNGAYTPYGIIVPIITATQLLGPYDIPVYRAIGSNSVYTNTVIVTPYRGAGRPQGCYAMERTMDRIADALGLDRFVVRERNLIQPDQFPYDQGLTFQDGRPVIYDSGDYPGLLAKLKTLVGLGRVRGAPGRGGRARQAARHRDGALRRGHRARAVRGRARAGAGQRQGAGVDRADVAGAGPRDGVRADRRLRARGADRGRRGAHRRHPPLRLRRRHVRLAGGGDERQRVALAAQGVKEKALRIAADVLEADPDDLEIEDGIVQVKGIPGASIPLRTVAVLSNPLRYAFDEAAKQATQFAKAGSDDKPPVAPGDAPGLEHTDYYSPIRSTFASGAHAADVEIDPETWEIDDREVLGRARLRHTW